jgi:hypothetical protein
VLVRFLAEKAREWLSRTRHALRNFEGKAVSNDMLCKIDKTKHLVYERDREFKQECANLKSALPAFMQQCKHEQSSRSSPSSEALMELTVQLLAVLFLWIR